MYLAHCKLQGGLTATNRVHHFNPVTVAKRGGGMLAARHYIQVELDRYPTFSQIQTADQVGNGGAVGQLE